MLYVTLDVCEDGLVKPFLHEKLPQAGTVLFQGELSYLLLYRSLKFCKEKGLPFDEYELRKVIEILKRQRRRLLSLYDYLDYEA